MLITVDQLDKRRENDPKWADSDPDHGARRLSANEPADDTGNVDE